MNLVIPGRYAVLALNGRRARPAVGVLPAHHRDPFDRLLVAQAPIERVPIMTADAVFDRYDVRVIKA